MHTAPHTARAPLGGRHFAKAYQQVAVASSLGSASPHELVAMLFDGLLESLTIARGALRSGDVATKAREVQRAVRIVDEGLRGSLNLAGGGELAHNLHALYAYLAGRLTLAHLRNDDALFEECVRLVEPVRDAWRAIAP